MPAARPFVSECTTLIPAAAGRPGITLAPMTAEDAGIIGRRLAAIDPWARLGFDAARFADFLAAAEDGAFRFKVLSGTDRAGAVVVRFPWLSGPYLNILGVVPDFQRRGIGAATLAWLEGEARQAAARNVWLCVSAFNADARVFYERHGYGCAAALEDLVKDGEDEILMRKRMG